MTRFDDMKGIFGLLPTPYRDDLEIHIDDLKKVANFCCESGQHGIVWPVMVGEFWFLGEEERVRGLDAVLEAVNGRLPVVFGCSGISVPQVLLYARAAQKAGVDSIIAMTPARTDAATAMDMYRRLGGVFDGPIMVQNADMYAPLRGEQVAQLGDEIPQVEYVKEERQHGPKHIAEVAEVLAKITELWWAGQEEDARAMHRRLLPLLILENHPFMRYILKRRGVFSTLVERAPTGKLALDEGDKREIETLLETVAGDIESFPILPEH